MKSAILAFAAATGLALTAGNASAHPPGGYYGGGYPGGGYPGGGYYAPRPIVVAPQFYQPYYAPPVYRPVYPTYGYGYGYAPVRPGFSVVVGGGYGSFGGFYRGW